MKRSETPAGQGIGERAARVLFVSHSSKLYGAERSLLLLTAGLDRRGFEPLVALPGEGPLREALEKAGVEVAFARCPWWIRAVGRGGRAAALLALPAVLAREALATARLCRLILRRRIDLVCTNTAVILGGALAARLCRRPHVWLVREILPRNPDLCPLLPLGLFHRLILGLSRMVLANSEATAAPLERLYPRAKVLVVHNAVQPLAEDHRGGNRLAEFQGLTGNDWTAAWVGSLQPRKAPEEAIRAVAEARGRIPGLRLLVIGDGRPDYVDQLKRLAGDLGVSDAVIFTGFREDARRLAAGCRALLMTAPNEPFGRVVAEAMFDGVPVVAVRGGGMAELVEDGIDGLLCPPGDAEALAGKLVHLYDHPEKAAELAGAAKAKVSTSYSAGHYVQTIEMAMSLSMEKRR